MVKLWLDDCRPAPAGWTHVRTIEEAKKYLLAGNVSDLSLDNDLGSGPPCDDCYDNGCSNIVEEGTCSCSCHNLLDEGYKLVDWMEEQNIWPKNKPTVHSQNITRKIYMEKVIAIWL
jgi:hypothetical protein